MNEAVGQPSLREARALAESLLRAVGLPGVPAEQTAQALVLADAWKVPSHGLMRLPFYLRRLSDGGCNPRAQLRTVTDTGPLVVFDGADGLGHWQVWQASETARDRCAQTGVGLAAVGRSSHCGALGVYTVPPLRSGMVALVFSHGPAVMPPWGGSAPVLSTSPLAAGIPCRPVPAIVDLATSAIARGRIKSAAQRGEALSEGWAFTATGEPTTDPVAALSGMLAPLGGAKGYALAFLVEALTAGLVGPALSTDVPDMFDDANSQRPQQIAHLVVVIDPARLDPSGSGRQRLDQLAADVEAVAGRVPGARRRMPDELDPAAPLAVAPAVWRDLRQWAKSLGIPCADGG